MDTPAGHSGSVTPVALNTGAAVAASGTGTPLQAMPQAMPQAASGAATPFAAGASVSSVARAAASAVPPPAPAAPASVLVLFYSTYGHTFTMAKAVAEGAREAGAAVRVMRIPETLPTEVLAKMHALDSQALWADVPVCDPRDDTLPMQDAIVLCTPTRFGVLPSQVQAFWDGTGQLWARHALAGKVGSVVVSTGSQHGGQETTSQVAHTLMLNHGMVLVGLPYAFTGMASAAEVNGLSPYGATTIAGLDGSRQPSAVELAGAQYQGRHVANVAGKLRGLTVPVV